MDNIHKGHRQRLKNKFLKSGLDSFNEHEIIELLLYFSIPQGDLNPTAHELISTFGSIKGIFEANFSDLIKVPKVGDHTATLLTLIPAITAKYMQSSFDNNAKLSSITAACEYVCSFFIGKKYESLYLICLNAQSKVNNVVCLGEGTVDQLTIYPRKIVEAAIANNAYGIIIAHNHPFGSPAPSKKDLNTTKDIVSALEAISIKVLDHIIVSGKETFSFSKHKLLSSNLTRIPLQAAQQFSQPDLPYTEF